MFNQKWILAACVASAAVLATAAHAQTPATGTAPAAPATAASAGAQVPEGGAPVWIKPETPEHRVERLGTRVDPGPNPDPETHFWRFGRSFHIERAERKWAAFDREEGFVRPMANVNFAFELYQMNDRYVWYWVGDPDPQQAAGEQVPPPPPSRYSESDLKYFSEIRPGFMPVEPAKNNRVIRFEESSDGLPQSGSFRNSMAIADMNGDGFLDLVLPPQRGVGEAMPAIYLGDGKGHWKGWAATVPHSLDYGSVVAADFNRDGHMDMAFSVHLTGIYVFLGDGKGHFTDVSQGLPRDFPSRRLLAYDIDHDGYPDLAAVTEGPTPRPLSGPPHGAVIAIMNRNKATRWEVQNVIAPPMTTGADWLTIGNFNNDGKPDFLLGSIYLGSRDILYLSGAAGKWSRLENEGDLIPWGAYYYANAAGKISSRTRDDAIITYVRYWPQDLPPQTIARPTLPEAVGIERLSFGADGKAKRTPIARWAGHEPVMGLALADVDGDGNLDIVYVQPRPRELVILLGDGKGGFTRASAEGAPMLDLPLYDLKVVDVNGDKKPDIEVMYETGSQTNAAMPGQTIRPTLGVRTGSVHVYLNRGAGAAAAPSKSSK